MPRVGLLARGEGFPEEVLAGLFIQVWGLLGGWPFLALGQPGGTPSDWGAGAGLGSPPGKESQKAAPPLGGFLHTVLASRATLQGKGGGCDPPEQQQPEG